MHARKRAASCCRPPLANGREALTACANVLRLLFPCAERDPDGLMRRERREERGVVRVARIDVVDRADQIVTGRQVREQEPPVTARAHLPSATGLWNPVPSIG